MYAPKIVLVCRQGYQSGLDQLVEQFIADGVKFVGVVGHDCRRVEDIIDELIVGDASDPSRSILTSAHPDESLEEVIAFADSLSEDLGGGVQVVELRSS